MLSANRSLQQSNLFFAANMVAFLLACLDRFPYADSHAGIIALVHIAASIACRNALLFELPSGVLSRSSSKVRCPLDQTLNTHRPRFAQWVPSFVRKACDTFLRNISSLHSGCASSGVAWFLLALVRAHQHRTPYEVSHQMFAIGALSIGLAALSGVAAMPWISGRRPG